MTPTASIVMATYNRPQVLGYAIRSVVQSSFTDWELIVVGDGCTDGTEELVRSFDDPRITWINLPENSGNQAAPNNAGVAQARGRYLLFLNHDDLWFAGHLGGAIEVLEATGADLVFSPVAILHRSGRDAGPPDVRFDVLRLDGVAPGRFDPETFVIASSWAMRREVADRVGPWHPPAATRLSPSQEWLHRAARAGCRIVYEPRISVLCIHGGTRRLSYLRPSPDHERAWDWVRGQEGPEAGLLEVIALQAAAETTAVRRLLPTSAADRLRSWLARAAARFGAHPHAVERLLRGAGKGAWIEGVRHHTHDPEPLRPGGRVPVNSDPGSRYLISGWHDPEDFGAWSATTSAIIGFELGEGLANPVLEVTGDPLKVPGEVTFRVEGGPEYRHVFTERRETVRIGLETGGRTVFVAVEVDDLVAPADLGINQDQRPLGFGLESVRLDAGGEVA